MFNEKGSLVYVGKASNLKRRLEGHSRGPQSRRDPRAARIVKSVREVRFIVCETEREALCLESDLIIAFVPPYNAAMAFETYTYLSVEPHRRGVRFVLTDQRPPASGRHYGGFPHLGKGRASWRGVRTNAGYSALLRLLWVAFADDAARVRIPGRVCGQSPPVDHISPTDPAHVRALHDFLSGRSARLLRTLRDRTSDDDVPAYMRGPLADDLVEAEEFHVIGPRRLHRLRVRHRLPPGPIDRETFSRLIVADTQAAVGTFTWSKRRRRRGRTLVVSGEV
jgi:hypothetical protein